MNKKLIALAVAGIMAAPMAAQAAPKLYGHLQAEITDLDKDGSTNDILQIDDNKRGRLGVKGSEDLGGGLKAIYQMEFQVETTTADIDDGDRNAFVGLKGGFGTIRIGANKQAYKYFGGVKYDPFVATYLQARGNGGMIKSETGIASSHGQNGFLKNSIMYTNKFGGATFWATYQLSETNPDYNDLNMGVKFKIGKSAEVFVAHADDDAATAASRGTNTKVGGQWKAGPHKISAQYEMGDSDAAGGSGDNDTIFLGYQFKMGKTVLVAQVGEVDFDLASANDKEYMAVGVIHNFSKKTRIFAGYRTTDVDNGATSDVDALTVGLRILF